MEYLVIIAVAVAVALLDDRLGGRKKVPPPTVPQDIPRQKKKTAARGTFEIPPMRGIPPTAQPAAAAPQGQEILRAAQEERCRQEARALRLRQEEVQRTAAEREAAAVTSRSTAAGLIPLLTPDAMQQAVVLSEILGRPRALRRFPQR